MLLLGLKNLLRRVVLGKITLTRVVISFNNDFKACCFWCLITLLRRVAISVQNLLKRVVVGVNNVFKACCC